MALAYLHDKELKRLEKRDQRTPSEIIYDNLLDLDVGKKFEVNDGSDLACACLEQIHKGMVDMINLMFNKPLEMDHNVKAEFHQEEALAPLNLASWSYFAISEKHGIFKPLTPFDCILLNQKIEEFEENYELQTAKLCETFTLCINLETMECKSTELDMMDLIVDKSLKNDRTKNKNNTFFKNDFIFDMR